MRKNRNLLRPANFCGLQPFAVCNLLRFANGDAANVNEKLKINYKNKVGRNNHEYTQTGKNRRHRKGCKAAR
jgi:hypothetical protein